MKSKGNMWVIALTLALIAIPGALVSLHFYLLDGLQGVVLSMVLGEDTAYAPGYSDPGFRAIRPGMSKSDVRSRLGEPLRTWTDPYGHGVPYTECWYYAWSPSDTDCRVRIVNFRGDQVESRTARFWVGSSTTSQTQTVFDKD